jgi:hypothetical protein
VYEPITVEVDRAHDEGNYSSYIINFVGRLIRMLEAGHTTMRLYEWADLGRLPSWGAGGTDTSASGVERDAVSWTGRPQLGQKRSSSLSSAPQFVQYL